MFNHSRNESCLSLQDLHYPIIGSTKEIHVLFEGEKQSPAIVCTLFQKRLQISYMIFPLSTANQVFPIPSWSIIMFLMQVAFLGLYPMIEQITQSLPVKQNDVNINGKDSSLNHYTPIKHILGQIM